MAILPQLSSFFLNLCWWDIMQNSQEVSQWWTQFNADYELWHFTIAMWHPRVFTFHHFSRANIPVIHNLVYNIQHADPGKIIVNHLHRNPGFHITMFVLWHCHSDYRHLLYFRTLSSWHFQMHSVDEKFYILIKISLKIISKGPTGNHWALVQVMAWSLRGYKLYTNRCWCN